MLSCLAEVLIDINAAALYTAEYSSYVCCTVVNVDEVVTVCTATTMLTQLLLLQAVLVLDIHVL